MEAPSKFGSKQGVGYAAKKRLFGGEQKTAPNEAELKSSGLKGGGVKNLDFSAGKENLDVQMVYSSNRGVVKHDKFAVSPSIIKEKPREHDPRRLAQRQKQISYGKNTLGHERYLQLVPKNARTRTDPQTPQVQQVCSKRSWDGQVKKWRQCLHEYDPPEEDGEQVDDIDGDKRAERSSSLQPLPENEHWGLICGDWADVQD